MTVITERHMDFLKEAKINFKENPHLTTWRDADNTMIALLHSWEDRDSQDITIIEIGETVARFEGCLKKEKTISIDTLNQENEIQEIIKKWRKDYHLEMEYSRMALDTVKVEMRLYIVDSMLELFK